MRSLLKAPMRRYHRFSSRLMEAIRVTSDSNDGNVGALRSRSAHPSASTHSNPLLGTFAPLDHALALMPKGTGVVLAPPPAPPVAVTVVGVAPMAEVPAASGGGEQVFCRDRTVMDGGSSLV